MNIETAETIAAAHPTAGTDEVVRNALIDSLVAVYHPDVDAASREAIQNRDLLNRYAAALVLAGMENVVPKAMADLFAFRVFPKIAKEDACSAAETYEIVSKCVVLMKEPRQEIEGE